MKLRVGFFLFVVCLTVALHSCRRNQPTLVDANRAPDTELWYAPPDSTEYDYLVHVFWRGVDRDGTVPRFIWAILDSITPPPLGWDPSARIRDLQLGRFTQRTDSVFSFQGFKNVGGVGLKKNRQAFYIAAIDDNGVIDPSPAAIEFVATIDKLPQIHFTTEVTKVDRNGMRTTISKPFDPAVLDTVGMFRPFKITYHGTTINGDLRAYKFFPLTANIVLQGMNEWTTDLSDTIRTLPNVGPDAIPSGQFRLAAQARDDAGAESRVDAGRFTEGVCRVVVNYEPDTELFGLINSYWIGNSAFVDSIDWEDSEPDTVPYDSWVTMFYRGWDSPFDSSLCQDVANECIRYQVQYTRRSDLDGGVDRGGRLVTTTLRWTPEDGEDNNDFGTADSTSMTMGSSTYDIRVRSVDEYEKPDGTPAEVRITGNFTPTIDSFSLVDYDGNPVADGDTLWWDWWRPANLGLFPTDTLDFSDPFDPKVVKKFFFAIKADGHDHPKEGTGQGIRAWLYTFRRRDTGTIARLNTSGDWTDGGTINSLEDTIQVTVRYSLVVPGAGDEAFANLPAFLNKDYDFTIRGKDAASADQFTQFMFVNGIKVPLNNYNTSALARWTGVLGQRFYLGMKKE